MTPKEWLNSERNFEEGVQTYSDHGANVNLKRFFTRPNTPLVYNKLVYELEQLAGVSDVPQVKPEDFIKHSPIVKPKIDRALLPQQYQALDVKKGRLYNKAQYLKAQLDNATTDESRKVLALDIVKTWREIDAIWERLDYWHQHGQMMPETTPAAIDIDTATETDLIRHRNNLRSNVSKLKKRPKRANDLLQKQKELELVVTKLIEKYGNG
jgi:hypothetical protein